MLRLTTDNPRHLYQLTVRKDGREFQIEVLAWTSLAAMKRAFRDGYEVCDINMIG